MAELIRVAPTDVRAPASSKRVVADEAGACEQARAGWSRGEVLSALHDAWTVSSSVVDIVADVAVTTQFYRMGEAARPFFHGSLLIFCTAQLTYAFLFAATWAKNLGARARAATFALALPVAQLVPLFAYAESFHLRGVDRCLRRLGLTPTDDPLGAAARAGADADNGGDPSSVDFLWSYIQAKYVAHAGFLAEALVEAVPQSVCAAETRARAARSRESLGDGTS